MIIKASKNAIRIKRHGRIRNRIAGTEARPRLSVYRSNKHIYAQIIDDDKGITLAAASSKALEEDLASTSGLDAAKAVGRAIGEAAQAKGVKKVVFDRGGYLYHGRVATLAEAAREAGLEF